MFDFEPGYWLIAMAAGIFILTAIVVLTSAMAADEDELAATGRSTRMPEDSASNATVDTLA